MRAPAGSSAPTTAINQLHENVVWGMRGNFVGIPTDCPQRDERLGWTGDIGVFAPTATFLYDCAGLLESWLRDLAAEQRDDGTVPWVIPDSLEWLLPAAVWGDAAVTVPATLYERFGDRDVLEQQYDSMRAWVDLELELAGDDLLWTGGFQFADWLDPTGADGDAFDQRTDPDLLATAAMIHSLDLLARGRGLLGRARRRATATHDLAREARRCVRARVRHAERTARIRRADRVLARDRLRPRRRDAEQRPHAGDRLPQLVLKSQLKIATGFVGTPLICDALTDTGHVDAAYGLLMQEECPSWLYPVLHGATTIWERWDAITARAGASTRPGSAMISFNHYAFGAVADWMHRVVGGLAPAAAGMARAPHRAAAGRRTDVAHRAVSTRPTDSRRRRGSSPAARVTVDAVVPPNTTAHVVLPGATDEFVVGSGAHSLDGAVRAAAPASPDAERGATWRPDARPRDGERRHPARPGVVRHRRQAHPGPRRVDAPRARHVLLVRREQGADDTGERRLALGRAVLLVHRSVQLARPRADHPARSRRPDVAAAPGAEDGPSPHHLQRGHRAVRLLAQGHG